MDRYGSLLSIFAHIDECQKIPGVTQKVMETLRCVLAGIQSVLYGKAMEDGLCLNSNQALYRYLQLDMGSLPRERVRVLFLGGDQRLIDDQVLAMGSIDRIAIDPRDIVAEALRQDASSLILIHNHPKGGLVASQADKAFTAAVFKALSAFKIQLLDHLLVTRFGVLSFRAEGMLCPQ
jgi:DNA repair protein RadC